MYNDTEIIRVHSLQQQFHNLQIRTSVLLMLEACPKSYTPRRAHNSKEYELPYEGLLLDLRRWHVLLI